MRLDNSPAFRKVIIPWYDTTPVCVVVIVLMAAVFLFGAVGVWVAWGHLVWQSYIGVPIWLMGLSGYVFLLITRRLISRKRNLPSKRKPRRMTESGLY